MDLELLIDFQSHLLNYKDSLKFGFSLSCPNLDSFFRSLSTEAYGMLKEVDKKGVALGPAPYDHLIRALLAEGSIEDAMAVKDM